MPGPLTHLYFCFKFFDEEKVSEEFVRGAVFPDIRYVIEVDREVTHSKCGSYEMGSETFQDGVEFHSLVDSIWREEFEKMDFDMANYKRSLISVSFKMVEDFMNKSLLENMVGTEKLREMLSSPVDGERKRVSSRELEVYYNSLTSLLEDGIKGFRNFLETLNFEEEEVEGIIGGYERLKEDENIITKIGELRERVLSELEIYG